MLKQLAALLFLSWIQLASTNSTMDGASGKANKEWTTVMADVVAKVNPYCSFRFKYHWMKKQPSRKGSNYCFRTKGSCTFSGCPMECVIAVVSYDQSNHPSSLSLHLSFGTTTVCHRVGERHARAIKGNRRKALVRDLKNQKPSSIRHQRLLQLTPAAYHSGKRDGVGVSPSVLQKISSESLHSEEEHSELCTSLMILREKQIEEEKNNKLLASAVLPNTLLPGYIQRVTAHPFSVMCYTETGIRIYHNILATSVLYCDATGTVSSLRSRLLPSGASRVLLYYSLVVRHPVSKCPPVAVAELLSTEHSVLAITHFLEAVRRAEGLIYGFSNLVKPHCVVIDRSLVLLISFLRVYNSEAIMNTYLHRCFRVVTGCASEQDVAKLFVLACVSHVMKNAKEDAKKLL